MGNCGAVIHMLVGKSKTFPQHGISTSNGSDYILQLWNRLGDYCLYPGTCTFSFNRVVNHWLTRLSFSGMFSQPKSALRKEVPL